MNKSISIIFLILTVFIISCSKEPDVKQIKAYQEAYQVYMSGAYSKAADLAKVLVKDNSGFHQAELLLGKSLFMSGRNDESLTVLAKLCDDYDFYPEAAKWKIRVLLQLEKTDEAIAVINKALSYDPQNIDFLHLAASAYAGTGDLQKQISYLSQIPIHSEKIGLAHLNLAKIYYSYLDYERAVSELNKSLLLFSVKSMYRKPVEDLKSRILEKMESQ